MNLRLIVYAYRVLFATPALSPALKGELKELDELRSRLGGAIRRPGRWTGTLRRLLRASAAEGSTSIEGFHVPAGEAVALVSGARTPDPDDENRMAVACYAHAMDHVGVMAGDPAFRWLDRVILDLHFDACSFQWDRDPGRWRTGPIGVTAPGGGLAYRGPDASDVPGLMEEVVAWLHDDAEQAHVVVRAAMAHLHVVSVHPFSDGNGRIARIAQSLVLARDGLLAPELGSIEEYLGRHTESYYAALQEAQGGGYQPDRDASGWVRFCVAAHVEQARQRLAQIDEAAARWAALEELVSSRGWPERLVIALEQSVLGGADRASYASEADIALPTASGDFRRLLDADLVVAHGRGRSVRYEASDALRGMLPR